jgi:hypothetical protein
MTRDAAVVATGSLEDAFGRHTRQQLGWLGFATLPLLFPVALPGMATTIGALSVLLALAVAVNRPLRLPGWLGRRNLPAAGSRAAAAVVRRRFSDHRRHRPTALDRLHGARRTDREWKLSRHRRPGVDNTGAARVVR